MPLYCNFICELSSTLIDFNIFGNLVPWKLSGYIIQLSNSLNLKPVAEINSFKSWKVLIRSRCWNVGNSSGKDLFLGRLQVVCHVGNEDRLLKRFWVGINNEYRIHQPLQHFSPCRNYFFSKCNSHSTKCFVAS